MNRWNRTWRRSLLALLCGLTVASTAAAPMHAMVVYADEADDQDDDDQGDEGDTPADPNSAEPAGAEDYTSDYRYAVQLYGVQADTLQRGGDDDEDQGDEDSASAANDASDDDSARDTDDTSDDDDTMTGGLTFGPALGGDYTTAQSDVDSEDADAYRSYGKWHEPSGETNSGNNHRCIHLDSWEQIIEFSYKDPYIYEQCVSEGCTKVVPLTLDSNNSSRRDKTKVFNTSKARKYTEGDGVSTLYYELWDQARRYTTDTTNTYNEKQGTNVTWANSQIRAVLNGWQQGETSSRYCPEDQYTYYLDGETGKYWGNSVLAAFPQALQKAIGSRVTEYASNYQPSQASAETVGDRLWLLSAMELYGNEDDSLANYQKGYVAYTMEGMQYERNSNAGIRINQKNPEAVAYKASDAKHSYWLRSRYYHKGTDKTYTNEYCAAVFSNGKVTYSDMHYSSFGVSPCFTLRCDPDFTQPDPTQTIDIKVDVTFDIKDDSQRPASLEVWLCNKGEHVFEETLELTADDNWTYTWTGLDEDGEYTIELESEISSRYGVQISGDAVNGFEILYYENEPSEPAFVRYHAGVQFASGVKRPQSLKVQLLRNGQAVDEPITLSADNDWEYDWYVKDDDARYTLSVTGVPDGYTAAVSAEGNAFVIQYSGTDPVEPEPDPGKPEPKPEPTPTPEPTPEPTPDPGKPDPTDPDPQPEPEDPSDPQPSEPSDPGKPSEPTDPSQPSEPSDPGQPSEPSQPSSSDDSGSSGSTSASNTGDHGNGETRTSANVNTTVTTTLTSDTTAMSDNIAAANSTTAADAAEMTDTADTAEMAGTTDTRVSEASASADATSGAITATGDSSMITTYGAIAALAAAVLVVWRLRHGHVAR